MSILATLLRGLCHAFVIAWCGAGLFTFAWIVIAACVVRWRPQFRKPHSPIALRFTAVDDELAVDVLISKTQSQVTT